MEGNEIQFKFKEEAFKYLIFWKWIVLSCVASFLVAYLYLRYVSDIYATQAKIQILDQTNNTFKLPSNSFNIFGDNDKDLENEIELIKSTRILNKVIDSLELHTEVYTKGKIKSIELWDTAPFKIIWGIPSQELYNKSVLFNITLKENGYLLDDKPTLYPYNKTNLTQEIPFVVLPKNESKKQKLGEYQIRLKPKNTLLQELSNNLTITKQGTQSNILKLVLKGGNTAKINDVLGALISIFDNDGVKDRQLVFEKTIEFVDDRFQYLFTELDSIEKQKAAYKKSQKISFIEADAGVIMQKSYDSENNIERIETQLVLADIMLNTINTSKELDLVPVNIGITNDEINGLSNKLNEVILNRNKYMSDGGGKTNPIVASLTQQVNAVKGNLKSTIISYKNTLAYQKRELSKIQGLSAKNYNRIPDNEKSLRSIERQQNIKETLYILLLQKREEAAVNLAITNPTIKLIEYPNFTSSPIYPDRALIYGIAFVIGLLIPLILIYIYFVSNDKIQTKSDLEQHLKLPVISEIPFVDANENKLIRVLDRSILSESFRILRTNLSFLLSSQKKRNQVIFVTSSIKGEGKTFVSINLAITLSSTNKKVVLLGADLRNPQLHSMLNYERKGLKGISNFIFDDKLTVEDVLVRGKEMLSKHEFDVIFSGTIPPNPAELLANDRFSALLDILKETYDYIVIDTAPTLLVTDTTVISGLADAILFVTRANFTEKKLFKHILDFQKINPKISFGLIINNVGQNKIYASNYSYGYNYGYGYGYEKNYSRKLTLKYRIARWFRKK